MNRSSSLEFSDKNDFAKWVVEKAVTHLVRVHGDASSFREELLKFSGRWPTAHLKKLEETHRESMNKMHQRSKDELTERVAALRTQLAFIIDPLFAVNAQTKSGKRHAAVQTLKAFVEEVEENKPLWTKVDLHTKFTLALPLRKKPEMRQLLHLLGPDVKSVWRDAAMRVFALMQAELEGAEMEDGSSTFEESYALARDCLIAKKYRALLTQWSCQNSAHRVTIINPVTRNGRVYCEVEEATSKKFTRFNYTRDRPAIEAVAMKTTPKACSDESEERPQGQPAHFGINRPLLFAKKLEKRDEAFLIGRFGDGIPQWYDFSY
uniref:Uncharacterized protein n=1 Tax=Peronospora matthiolae TaxID=2874970 RepID=A0AAV1V1R6_9STRA